MDKLTRTEKTLATRFYHAGWSPVEITKVILDKRVLTGFTKLDMEVHHFLMLECKKQMYPEEVYGKLEDIKRRKEDV